MCAQLCGITHYSMQGRVNIKSKEEYDAWAAAELEKKTAEPEVFDEDMFD
jgi:heme/copper-type cytochrome/quinol oxidase subunit 2